MCACVRVFAFLVLLRASFCCIVLWWCFGEVLASSLSGSALGLVISVGLVVWIWIGTPVLVEDEWETPPFHHQSTGLQTTQPRVGS